MREGPRVRLQSSKSAPGEMSLDGAIDDENNGKNKSRTIPALSPRNETPYWPQDYGSRTPLVNSATNKTPLMTESEYVKRRVSEELFKSDIDRALARKRMLQLTIFLILIPLVVWMSYDNVTKPLLQEVTLRLSPRPSTSDIGTYGVHAPITFSDPLIKMETLDPSRLPTHDKYQSRRLVFVGDVHGCKVELLDLLDEIDFLPNRDHLVFTGDMIDKGPSSNGVIRLARKLGASCVRGNHEDKMLLQYGSMSSAEIAKLQEEDIDTKDSEDAKDMLDRELTAEERLHHQEVVTPQAHHTTPDEFSKASLKYLSHCPVILRVGNITDLPGEVIVVHAGLAPNVPLLRQDPLAVMTMRTIDYKTGVPSHELEGRHLMPWWRIWNHEQKKLKGENKNQRRLVVYGHDSKTGLNKQKYSVGLDSGCVKGGRLSALILSVGRDGKARKEIESVKCKRHI